MKYDIRRNPNARQNWGNYLGVKAANRETDPTETLAKMIRQRLGDSWSESKTEPDVLIVLDEHDAPYEREATESVASLQIAMTLSWAKRLDLDQEAEVRISFNDSQADTSRAPIVTQNRVETIDAIIGALDRHALWWQGYGSHELTQARSIFTEHRFVPGPSLSKVILDIEDSVEAGVPSGHELDRHVTRLREVTKQLQSPPPQLGRITAEELMAATELTTSPATPDQLQALTSSAEHLLSSCHKELANGTWSTANGYDPAFEESVQSWCKALREELHPLLDTPVDTVIVDRYSARLRKALLDLAEKQASAENAAHIVDLKNEIALLVDGFDGSTNDHEAATNALADLAFRMRWSDSPPNDEAEQQQWDDFVAHPLGSVSHRLLITRTDLGDAAKSAIRAVTLRQIAEAVARYFGIVAGGPVFGLVVAAVSSLLGSIGSRLKPKPPKDDD